MPCLSFRLPLRPFWGLALAAGWGLSSCPAFLAISMPFPMAIPLRLSPPISSNLYILIFPSSIGTPLDQCNLYRRFKELIRRAGLPEIRFHDLRHTAASLMLNHGVPVFAASRRLGHSKVSITLDIYGHLIQEMQNEAAELIDELITPIKVELIAPQLHHHPETPELLESNHPHI